MESIFAELDGESDRAAISVGGSLLEHALEKYIESRMRRANNKEERRVLFHDQGILSSFYEKIWTGYFFNLIGSKTRRDIDLIRLIRNEISHNMNPVSFDTPEIAARCRELDLAKESIPGQQVPADLRRKFLFTIKFLSGVFQLKANDHIFGVKEALQELDEYIAR